MDPYIAQALTEAHIAQRHREAAERRRARAARRRRGTGVGLRTAWMATRTTARDLLAARTRPAGSSVDPTCCPA